MIREYRNKDADPVLDIWLQASIKAHHFMDPLFWESKLNDMRRIYIPAADTWVYEEKEEVLGFYSLCENTLAAIFVHPNHQGKGIGTALMNHAKDRCEMLDLNVFKENRPSYEFYISQGFTAQGEQVEKHTGCVEIRMEWKK